MEADSLDAACIAVKCGEKQSLIAFKPYRADITELLKDEYNTLELEFILTRRNTFGPLHLPFTPIYPHGYGPYSYTTEGNHFLYDRYNLLPQGMTGEIRISYYDIEIS